LRLANRHDEDHPDPLAETDALASGFGHGNAVSFGCMELNIRFPGGLAVEADLDGHTVRTDQPEAAGGHGAAPSPFDLFLASIGTCAGYYALRFCQARGLPTENVTLKLVAEKDPSVNRVTDVAIEIELPPDFPPRYREALVRATDQCSVKKHLVDPPRIEVVARPVAAAPSPAPPVAPLLTA
jgi:ribosomal protein S12 methylthiotransferase accessory factor